MLKVFQSAPPEHKAFITQLIGSTRNPAAKACLWLLLDDPNRQVVLATIRGLSAIGGDDVTSRITGILKNENNSDETRIEAAIGLGTIGTTTASRALIEALEQFPAAHFATPILNSLAKFPFSNVSEVFDRYINASAATPEMRTAAIEALAHSSADSVPFLLRIAAADPDSDARSSAAWAIGAHFAVTDQGPALFGLIEQESEADVRRRLYEALLGQKDVSADQLAPIVQSEWISPPG